MTSNKPLTPAEQGMEDMGFKRAEPRADGEEWSDYPSFIDWLIDKWGFPPDEAGHLADAMCREWEIRKVQ